MNKFNFIQTKIKHLYIIETNIYGDNRGYFFESYNKKDFFDSIDRTTLMIRESEKKPVIIDVKDTSMSLAINSGIGSMSEDIDISKEGKDILIGFNPKFLMDALKVIDEEEITMYMINPKAPCFIRNMEETYVYLILPVNFN